VDLRAGASVVGDCVVGGEGGLVRFKGKVGSSLEKGGRSCLGLRVGFGVLLGGGMAELERLVLVVLEEVPIKENGVTWETGSLASLTSLGGVRPSRGRVRGERGVVGGPGSQMVGVGGRVGVVGREIGVVGGFDESGMGRVTPSAVAYCARES